MKSLHALVQKTYQKTLIFLEPGGGRDSLPRVLRAGATGLQTLNIARCCCQASSLEGLRESQRNVEGHVLSNNRRKEIEGRTGEREVKQRKGLRRSMSTISSFSINDMSLVAPEVKQLSIRSQSKALVSMRYQSNTFYSTLNQGKRGKGRQSKRRKERKKENKERK